MDFQPLTSSNTCDHLNCRNSRTHHSMPTFDTQPMLSVHDPRPMNVIHPVERAQGHGGSRHPSWALAPIYPVDTRIISMEQIRAETLERTLNARKPARLHDPPDPAGRVVLPSFNEAFPDLSDLPLPPAKYTIGRATLLSPPPPPLSMTKPTPGNGREAPHFFKSYRAPHHLVRDDLGYDVHPLPDRSYNWGGSYRDDDAMSLSSFSDNETSSVSSRSDYNSNNRPINRSYRSLRPVTIWDNNVAPTRMLPFEHMSISSPPIPSNLSYVDSCTGSLGSDTEASSISNTRRRPAGRNRSSAAALTPSSDKSAGSRDSRKATKPRATRRRRTSKRVNPDPTERQPWEDYVLVLNDREDTYRCLWKRGGPSGPRCTYHASKQPMKRHVEITHMRLKPHPCSYCDRWFGQKTALEVHEATHTGAKPYGCRYGGCPRRYSDPARRLRHHVKMHGYVTRKFRRQNRQEMLPEEDDLN